MVYRIPAPGTPQETFQSNWSPHYDSNVGFGTVLSLFYPCFTGTNFSGEFHLEFSGDFFLGEPRGLAKIGDLYDVNRDMNRYTTNKTGRLQQSCGKFMGILWDHDGIRMGYRGIEQDLVGHAYMIIYVLFGDLTGSFPEVARMVNCHRGNHPHMALFQVSE